MFLGSFVNVCIYRLPINKQIIVGRSFCPKCKKKINWFDNIPLISFIFLFAKCRKCKKEISIKYFFVELISGIIFLYLFLNYDNFLEVIFLQTIFLILLIIFFIDLKYFIIPDSLNYTLIFLGFIKNYLSNFSSNFFTYDIYQSIIGGLFGFLLIWLIIFIYKKLKKIEAMGLGDAKFLAAVGVFFGWQSIWSILFVASVVGIIVILPSLLKNKRNLKSTIPFGPYLVISSIIYYNFGNLIM